MKKPAHPARKALTDFLVAALLLCAGAGVLRLLMDEEARNANRRSNVDVAEVSDRCRFVETPGGVRAIPLLAGPGVPEPDPASVLGSAQYYTRHAGTGAPYPTRVEFQVEVWDIASSHGPPAADTKAWRAIVAQSIQAMGTLDGLPVHVPRAGCQGEETSNAGYPLAFVQNAAVHLWRAPLWLAACLGLALLRAAAPACVRWVRRRRATTVRK